MHFDQNQEMAVMPLEKEIDADEGKFDIRHIVLFLFCF